MDEREAKRLSKLEARERPEALNEFLRCQLGRVRVVTVQTSPFRRIEEKSFELVAYGKDWDSAVAMWKRL